jgi:hypothetical protein
MAPSPARAGTARPACGPRSRSAARQALWPPQSALLTGRLRPGRLRPADRAVRPRPVSGAVGRPAAAEGDHDGHVCADSRPGGAQRAACQDLRL